MKENLPQPELHTPHKPDSTVRDLVLQAQAGSREAYLALTARYRPLLESSVARFGASEMTDQERRDLREEAERVFLGAISSYDTDQDAVDFGLYAKICLRNGLVSEWRHLQTLRRVVSVPMEEELSPDLTVPDPAQELEEEERFSKLCRTVREQLSDYENQVWWQYVTGVSVSDIAEGLGRDERSVHNAIYRIRKKLREKITPTEE
jgi:RNA polymerase sigma factor (sigma-70 family)